MLRNAIDKSITACDFRRLWREITEKISDLGGAYLIARRGPPWLVILSVDAYESLIDERLAESPALRKRMAEARANYHAGEGRSYEALRREILSSRSI